MILASHTGWALDDLLEMTTEEMLAWLDAVKAAQPKVK